MESLDLRIPDAQWDHKSGFEDEDEDGNLSFDL